MDLKFTIDKLNQTNSRRGMQTRAIYVTHVTMKVCTILTRQSILRIMKLRLHGGSPKPCTNPKYNFQTMSRYRSIWVRRMKSPISGLSFTRRALNR